MDLSEPYLDCGRTIIGTYCSIKLAELLQSRKTHIVETLRINRKSNPLEIKTKQLKRKNYLNEN